MYAKHGLTIGTLIAACLFLGNAAKAEEDDGGKGKGKGAKPEVKSTSIQIDLSKLPPDLVKQLLKYTADSKGKPAEAPKGKPAEAPKGKPAEAPKGKAETAKGKPAPAPQLPPGLAKKPKDHPGRLNFVKHTGGKKELLPAPEPKKSPAPSKGKKGGEEEA